MRRLFPLIMLAGAMLHLPGCGDSQPPLDSFWQMPAFTLTDQAGQTVTSDSLRGRVLAIDFFFTRCPAICPILSRNMQRLSASLGDLPAADIQLVSISLDPDHDTPEVLAEFGQAIHADPGRWSLLTGPRQAIWDLSNDGFKLAVDPILDDPANPISHTGRVVLVDRQGMIRGYYDGLTEEGMTQLEHDLRRLAADN